MQRRFWASTGVKDEAYDDTRYAVDLAAPDSRCEPACSGNHVTKGSYWLGGVSVGFGAIAAVLWLCSALVTIPAAPGGTIGGTLLSEPFNVAMQTAGRLNAWAAAMTAVSVFFGVLEKGAALMGRRRLKRNEDG